MKEFLSTLLGNVSPAQFLALYFFAFVGVAISLLIQTTNRDINSEYTPRLFSWRFFFEDNFKRIILDVLLIYVALRFAPELFGVNIDPFWALVIGLGKDMLAMLIKDKTNLLGQKKIKE